MATGRRVLLIDGLSETEQVLKAVLEPRGLQVDRVRADRGGEHVCNGCPPQVVVIHEDERHQNGRDTELWRGVPQVIIGTAEITDVGEFDDARHCLQQPERHYMQNPFQYRELIQAIERLLSKAA